MNSINASLGYNEIKNERCFMELPKHAIDLTGKKFSDLTAIHPIKPGKYRGINWLCKCKCGKETIAYGGHLRAGMRKSCGCLSQSRIHETVINNLFCSYRRKAKQRNKEFSIDRNIFEKLVTSVCHYCGMQPHQELKRQKSKNVHIKYNGIDRYDPSLGYTNENCVSCCYYCNHAKLDLRFDEWIKHIKNICSWLEITNGI